MRDCNVLAALKKAAMLAIKDEDFEFIPEILPRQSTTHYCLTTYSSTAACYYFLAP